MNKNVNDVENCADKDDGLYTSLAARATNFSDAQEIAFTSIRPIRFSKENLLILFIQIIAIRLRIAQDAAKYQHALSSLNPDKSSRLLEIKDLIKRPPQSGKYEALKERIMSEF